MQKAPHNALGLKLVFKAVSYCYNKCKDYEIIEGMSKVFIDKFSIFHLLGTTIDYKETLDGSRFTKHKCRCGKSFC